MDFNDSPEDAAFRAEWRAWLEASAPRRTTGQRGMGALMVQTSAPDLVDRARAWQRTLCDGGWGAISWPAEYGGRGATPTQAYIYLEELAAFDVPLDIFVIGLGMVGPTLIAWGSDEQKARYLRPLLDGSEIWCQLWSEPGAGSDVASLSTRAEWDESNAGWMLNGQKVWTSAAQFARWGLAIVRTDPDAPKHRGISALVVDMQALGVEVRPLKEMSGGATFNEVFFTDVFVPAEQLVGPLNHGWSVALTTLAHERVTSGFWGLTAMRVDSLLNLAREVQREGRPVCADPAIRDRLAEVYTRHKVLTLTIYRTLTAMARSGEPGPEASTLKLAWSDLATRHAELAVDILGLSGLLTGADAPDGGVWVKGYTFAPSNHIAGGTDEIQKSIIGERVLGLPREPSVPPA